VANGRERSSQLKFPRRTGAWADFIFTFTDRCQEATGGGSPARAEKS